MAVVGEPKKGTRAKSRASLDLDDDADSIVVPVDSKLEGTIAKQCTVEYCLRSTHARSFQSIDPYRPHTDQPASGSRTNDLQRTGRPRSVTDNNALLLLRRWYKQQPKQRATMNQYTGKGMVIVGRQV